VEGILEFVKTLPETVHTLVVPCEGGFSRSAGVVKAFRELHDYKAEEARLIQANRRVKKTLLETAKSVEQKKKRKNG